MRRQIVARRNVGQQRNQARALIAAAQKPHTFVLEATVVIEQYAGLGIVPTVAGNDTEIGSLKLQAGEKFYYVASRTQFGRFYAASFSDAGDWRTYRTSTTDQATQIFIIRKLRTYMQELAEKAVQA